MGAICRRPREIRFSPATPRPSGRGISDVTGDHPYRHSAWPEARSLARRSGHLVARPTEIASAPFDPRAHPHSAQGAGRSVRGAGGTRIRHRGAREDEDIDTSDIPVNYNAKWVRVNPLLGVGNKQLVTLRIDPEVLDFFKSHGKRYQTRINAVLQEYVRTHQNS